MNRETNQRPDRDGASRCERRPYVAPALTVYGTVEKLTAGVSPTGSKDGGIFGGNPLSRPLG
jgi:hypothetical protein